MTRFWRLLISLVTGICVWIFIEIIYPVAFPNTPSSAKVFWRIFFVILSIILAEVMQGLYGIDSLVRKISNRLQALGGSPLDKAIEGIQDSYYKEFRGTDEKIKTWVENAVTDLHKELASGYISMFPESARDQMAEMYGRAKKWVVVTNVGELEFFFDNANYCDLNLQAFERGIPVIRFFLYGSPPRQAGRALTLAEFRGKAIESMKKMRTVCGVIIPANVVSTGGTGLNGPQDFLLIDNSFVAHAELDQNTWEMRRIRATVREENLRQYRQYLHDLRGIRADEVIYLDEINGVGFDGKKALGEKMRRRANQIVEDIMEEVTSTRAS